MSHLLGPDVRALHDASRKALKLLESSTDAQIKVKRPANPLGSSLSTLLESLSVSSSSPDSQPSPAECATHLELLEVFLQLRLDVLNSKALDHTFGIKEVTRTVFRKVDVSGLRSIRFEYKPVKLRDKTFQARRREKWSYYLSIAVERFIVWVEKADAELAELAESTSLDRDGLPLRCLPPVDVLMVWHAFLLNPRDFATYCVKEELGHIRKVPFPWAHIVRLAHRNACTSPARPLTSLIPSTTPSTWTP